MLAVTASFHGLPGKMGEPPFLMFIFPNKEGRRAGCLTSFLWDNDTVPQTAMEVKLKKRAKNRFWRRKSAAKVLQKRRKTYVFAYG